GQIGDVLKFGGDALLVLFTGPNHAERACRAALGMRASVKRPLLTRSGRTVRLRISIGAHSGLFNVFLLDAGHRELIVTGPAATRTVLCEAEAAAGQILVTESTAALLGPGWRQEAHPHGRLLLGTTRAHAILRLDEEED